MKGAHSRSGAWPEHKFISRERASANNVGLGMWSCLCVDVSSRVNNCKHGARRQVSAHLARPAPWIFTPLRPGPPSAVIIQTLVPALLDYPARACGAPGRITNAQTQTHSWTDTVRNECATHLLHRPRSTCSEMVCWRDERVGRSCPGGWENFTVHIGVLLN
jgi:hypothetical protein